MTYTNNEGHQYRLEEMIPAAQVNGEVSRLAREIEQDYSELHLLGLLKGSFVFLSDLIRELKIPVTVDFMAVSSYIGTESSGEVKILKELNEPIHRRNVLIVEDIVDTGLTLFETVELLTTRDPADISICTLLDKHERREKEINVGYTGFTIPDKFVVGYGIDYQQRHRELSSIATVNFL
jgi:hypoxanthine phosphoribosyltransferase